MLPPPQVAGVMHRDGGGIWVVTIVASERWEPGLSPADGIDAIYDTRPLRIEPETRTLTHDVRTDSVCQPVGRGVVSCADELGEAMRLHRLRTISSLREVVLGHAHAARARSRH